MKEVGQLLRCAETLRSHSVMWLMIKISPASISVLSRMDIILKNKVLLKINVFFLFFRSLGDWVIDFPNLLSLVSFIVYLLYLHNIMIYNLWIIHFFINILFRNAIHIFFHKITLLELVITEIFFLLTILRRFNNRLKRKSVQTESKNIFL